MRNLFLILLAAAAAFAQSTPRRGAWNVEHYNLDADIDPTAQTVKVTAEIRMTALEDRLNDIVFELNDALRVNRVTDDKGSSLSFNKGPKENQFTVTFPANFSKNGKAAIKVSYDGRLAGEEESPVFGIRFAAIRPTHTFLLYPSRWFPINDYTTDRYTMTLRVNAPAGFKAISSGMDSKSGSATVFETKQPGFPGSLALVQGDGQKVSSQGVNSTFYLRDAKSQAQVYGDEAGKILSHFASIYGVPPTSNLTFVETERGAPAGYSTPGVVYLSPGSISSGLNVRLLANQLARQWWGNLISTTSRNNLWITNGMARMSEVLYIEQVNGPGAAELELKDVYIDSLTADQVPLAQSGRFEDYSPEFVAATSAKGAGVFNMLRAVLTDKLFTQFLKELATGFADKAVGTPDIRQLAEKVSGQSLDYFFIQWVESSGAPEFKLEYTVFRTARGFRIVGKVKNDLDTFRMPVDLKIETEGNPEFKTIEVIGASSEFTVDTFGKPKAVLLDYNNHLLRFSDPIRVSVAIRKGEQLAEVGEYEEALKEYQKALDVNRASSIAHYRVAESFFQRGNYQAAANEFREVLNGDLEPKWTEVWSRINLGKIFDVTGQRERAVNEYNLAIRTKDNTQGAQEEAAKYLQTPYKRQSRAE
jgi:aminopeptidase N